jgi:hypothetical protein
MDTLAPAGTVMALVLKAMYRAIRSPKMVFPGDEAGVEVVEGTGIDELVAGGTDEVTDGEIGLGVTDVIKYGDVVVGTTEDCVPPEHAVNTVTNITTAARVNIRIPVKSFI